MKTAIISDIHANVEALEAVLNHIDQNHVDEIICLGDVVGYGANPNECADIIRDRCPLTLMGNHDAAALNLLNTQNFNIHARVAIEWTIENMSDQTRQFLQKLPIKGENDLITFVHATPYESNMWYYITSLEEAAFNFQFFQTRFCFIGHTHIPLIIGVNETNEVFVVQETKFNYNSFPTSRFMINVGSVGQPRDHNPQACYGTIDTDQELFSIHRVDYNFQKAQAKMRKIKMPDFLIDRLETGR